jgi:Arc/MetJ family transcription regulator
MRTTIDLDESLLEEVTSLLGEKSPSKAVNEALREYVRKARARELIESLGTWDLDLDDWYAYRHSERT